MAHRLAPLVIAIASIVLAGCAAVGPDYATPKSPAPDDWTSWRSGDAALHIPLEAARQNAPLELHLLGYVFRTFKAQPEASLTIHGTYKDNDLPRLLERLQPHLVWFPAVWPETYSYTLSTCLQAGLPVVTTDLGAFTERLAQRPWTWVRPWDTSAQDWLAFFLQLRQQHFIDGTPPEGAPAVAPPATPQESAWDYARDYLQGLPPVRENGLDSS